MYSVRGQGWPGSRAAASASVGTNKPHHHPNNPHSRSIFANRRGSGNSRYHDGAYRGAQDGAAGQVQLMVQRQQEQGGTLEQTQKGGITMEEVMKDLRILEEQQKESEQKLRQAQVAKEQRLTNLQIDEDKLQKVKYKNGQDRAYLYRVRESLASGQRMLQSCKDDESRFRKDLEGVGQNLNRGLRVMRHLQASKRRQERVWSQVLQVDDSVQCLLERARDQLAATMEKRTALQLKEQSLQLSIQGALSSYQATQQGMAKERELCSHLEQSLEDMQSKLSHMEKKGESLEKELAHEEKRFQDRAVASEGSMDLRRNDGLELQSKIKIILNDIKENKEAAGKAWSHVHQQRIAEGQGSDSTTLSGDAAGLQVVPLDLDRLRASVRVEAQAVEDEVAALNVLRDQVIDLCRDKHSAIQECQAKRTEVQFMQDANLEAKKLQKHRMDLAGSLVDDHNAAKQRRDEWNEEVARLQEQRNQELVQASRRLKQANESFQRAQGSLAEARSQVSSVTKQIQTVETEFKAALERVGKTPLELSEHMAVTKEMYNNLHNELKAASERMVEVDSGFASEGPIESIEQLNAEMHRLVEAFPQIELVPFEFDSDLSLDSHVERSLGGLRKECENRVSSAIKMGIALREAKKQEAHERALVEKAAAAEERRLEETRLERKKRLQEDETEEERARREDRKRRRERKREQLLLAGITAVQKVKKDCGLSAAKPRVLLKSFSQASDGMALELDYGPTIHDHQSGSLLASAQEKKVHWGDERSSKAKIQSRGRSGELASGRQEARLKDGVESVCSGSVLQLQMHTSKSKSTSSIEVRDKKRHGVKPSNTKDYRCDFLVSKKSEKLPLESEESAERKGHDASILKSALKSSSSSSNRHWDHNQGASIASTVMSTVSANSHHSKESTHIPRTSDASGMHHLSIEKESSENCRDAGHQGRPRERKTFAKLTTEKPKTARCPPRKEVSTSRHIARDSLHHLKDGSKQITTSTCDINRQQVSYNEMNADAKEKRSDSSKSSRAKKCLESPKVSLVKKSDVESSLVLKVDKSSDSRDAFLDDIVMQHSKPPRVMQRPEIRNESVVLGSVGEKQKTTALQTLSSSGNQDILKDKKTSHRSKRRSHTSWRIKDAEGCQTGHHSKMERSNGSTMERSKSRTEAIQHRQKEHRSATERSSARYSDKDRKTEKVERSKVGHDNTIPTSSKLQNGVHENYPLKEASRQSSSQKRANQSSDKSVSAKRHRSVDDSKSKSAVVSSTESAPHPQRRRKPSSVQEGRKKLEWYADDSHCRFL